MTFLSMQKFMSGNAAVRRIACILALAGIIGYAFLVRMNTFWLPHWMGDQSHHITLAMKLDTLGFSQYNLRGVKIGVVPVNNNEKIQIVYPYLMRDRSAKGDLLEALDFVGIHYYDQPFFHKPPALPYALVWSHRLFAKKGQPYSSLSSNMGESVYRVKPAVFFEAQFYAAVVPLAFSLGLVIATFILGRVLFSVRTGLYAAFIMAINPVSIMTAQKVWADDMVSLFTTVALILFLMARKRKSGWFMVLAGASCGVAVLAKQTGGYLFIAFIVFFAFCSFTYRFDIRRMIREVLNKEIILFSLGVFAISGFWFIKIYTIYGNPLYLPYDPTSVKTDWSGWFKTLMKLPPGWILYPVGGVYLCPPFFLAFATIKDFIACFFRLIQRKAHDEHFVLLWFVIATFYYFLGNNREYRYMLPVYPALSVLSAYYLELFVDYSGRFARYTGNRFIREAFVITLLVVCAVWSVPIGIKTGVDNIILLRLPFK